MKTKLLKLCLAVLFMIIVIALGCTQKTEEKETFSLNPLVVVIKEAPDSTILALHSQHHPHNVLERRSLPGSFNVPGMTYYSEHVATLDELVVINPGPGEYVHFW